MLPKPWPPDHALRKVEELCAIHKANVTIALLFQPATLFVRNQHIALEVKMAWRDPRKCSAGRAVRRFGVASRSTGMKVRKKFGRDANDGCMGRLAPLHPSEGSIPKPDMLLR